MRFALLLSSLLVTACTVGAVGDTGGGLTGTDGGGGGPSSTACLARLPDPQVPPHMHLAGNTTNAGLNCMTSGCHLQASPGAGAPGFGFAGTIYKSDGKTANAGVAIRIKGGSATPLVTYSDLAGNFYLDAQTVTASGLKFPATVDASACAAPSMTPLSSMVTTVDPSAAATSSCNLCHVTGGATTPMTLADQ